ncbi:MAG: 30S ribosomal protein S21 [Gammaproteobacteria bacterium]|nr:30S ribosomal protein S21 [Gammaproteobacteria bacterium]
MPIVKIKENDSYPEGLIRKFKKAVERSGILAAVKNCQYYVKPSKLKQREKAAAIKRWRKKNARDAMQGHHHAFRSAKKFRSLTPVKNPSEANGTAEA